MESTDPLTLKQLIAGANALGLPLNTQQEQRFKAYLVTLLKWNKAYNLTAIREPKAIIIKHFLDSLAIAPHIQGDYILDVGTGAGFPGIPLAIYYPQKQFVLLDSNAKKTRFLHHTQQTLALDNVHVVKSRVEDYKTERKYSTIVCRALGSIEALLPTLHKLCSNNGLCVFMCGQYPEQPLPSLPATASVTVVPLHIPYLEAARHLVKISNGSPP